MENWLRIAGTSKRDGFDEREFPFVTAGVKRRSIGDNGQPGARLNVA